MLRNVRKSWTNIGSALDHHKSNRIKWSSVSIEPHGDVMFKAISNTSGYCHFYEEPVELKITVNVISDRNAMMCSAGKYILQKMNLNFFLILQVYLKIKVAEGRHR